MLVSGMDLFFWAAGLAVHLILLFVLFYRKRAKVFPFFTALIVFNVVRTVVLYFVVRYGTKSDYVQTFWSAAVLDVVAAGSVTTVDDCRKNLGRDSPGWLRSNNGPRPPCFAAKSDETHQEPAT